MKLSPEIIKMRNALLERIGKKPLKEVAQIVNEILLNETNSINRLAALAARVKLLRDYIGKNYEVKNNSKKNLILDKEKKLPPAKKDINEVNEENKKEELWVRVEMLKSGVVNGVRFPEGVVIDVNKDDADKLVEDKLSKIINIGEEKVEAKEEEKVEEKVEEEEKEKVEEKAEVKEEEKVEAKVEAKVEEKVEEKVETEKNNKEKTDPITQKDSVKESLDKKIIKTKSTKITEETIELTDPKAVAEALGLNKKKQEEDEPKEIEEEIDIEAIETGRKK